MDSIILVYGLNSQHLDHWDSISNLQWCRERFAAQHTEANIMAYVYKDLNMQASPISAVDKAARDLLSELDGSKSARCTSTYTNLMEAEGVSVLNPTSPVLFICRGLAGLIVKKVYMLDGMYTHRFG